MPASDYFFDLLFELSNQDRYRILQMLDKENSNVTTIATHLAITTQETSRHINRLAEVGLTQKTVSGEHDLTPYGMLMLKSLSGLLFFTSNKDYFREHIASDLPARFFSRLNELNESRLISDVMVVFANIERIIEEANEFVWRLTDRYNMMALPELESATARHIQFRLMQTKHFQYPPDWPGPGVVLRDARLAGDFEVRSSSTANFFLAMNEKEVAMLAFPLRNNVFDYRGFSAKDPEFIEWCKEVFEYHWKNADPVR